ncbi:MAG: O-antigen ligase family protein [Candidatus Vogelbacteria bacterium]|nr:O-antigen ligase family protein [Candidatus Vogelbacteria bacterium]
MTIKYVLRGSVVVGLFGLLLTPLLVSNSLFFPYITGKAFFFRLITEIIFALWLGLILLDKSYRPRRSLLLLALTVFTAIVTLATIFSQNPARSFWSNFERMEGLITYFHLLAYFVVLGSVLQSEKLWRWFFNFSIAVSVVVGLYSLSQIVHGLQAGAIGRIDATLGNPTYLAVYMLINVFLAAWQWWRARAETGWPYLYGPVIFLQLVVLYYTATRGAILGFIGGGLIAALIMILWGWREGLVKRLAGGLFLGLIILTAGFWLLKDASFVKQNPVLSRFANISLTEQTTESRLTIWAMSLRGFKERPLLGWGPENYNLVFNKYYEPKLFRNEQWFDRSHNIFFDWLISAGLLGLIGYLSLFALVFYYIWRRSADTVERALWVGFLVAYFFQNIFVFDNLISYLLFWSILAYWHRRSLPSVSMPPTAVNPKSFGRQAAAVIIAAATIFIIYAVNVKPWLANRNLIRALTPSSDPVSNLTLFKQVLASGTPIGFAETREQLLNTALGVYGNDKIATSTRELFINLAANEMGAQVKQAPTDARHQLFLGTFLLNLGQTQLALPYLERAHELSPRKQTIMFALARGYFQAGQSARAVKLTEEAFNLDRRFESARNFLIELYVGTKNYPEVLKLWQEAVAIDPANVQSRLSLAASYLANGKRDLAIEALEAVLTLDPKQKAQVDFYIKEIRAGRNPVQE